MRGIKMLLQMKDQSYLKSVLNYLEESKCNTFAITIWNGVIEKELKYDLIVSDQLDFLVKLKCEKLTLVYVSTELVDETQICNVFKYMPGDQWVKALIKIYTQNQVNFHVEQGNHQTQIIGVSSCEGGSGKTFHGVFISKLLGLNNQKTLFLSTDGFDMQTPFFDFQGNTHFGEWLMYVKNNDQHLVRLVETMCCHEGDLQYFKPSAHPMDTHEITYLEWESLLKQIQKEGIYDYIVIDLDQRFFGKLKELLHFDIVIGAKREDKLNRFLSMKTHHELKNNPLRIVWNSVCNLPNSLENKGNPIFHFHESLVDYKEINKNQWADYLNFICDYTSEVM